MRSRTRVIAGLVFGALALPLPARAQDAEWLSVLNAYRASAGLPAVSDMPEHADGAHKHSRYMVKNGVVVHAEDPSNPWYTKDGDEAGRAGNVVLTSGSHRSDRALVEFWMAAPFHGLGMIDPALQRSSFGTYREDREGRPQNAATLDVLRGRGSSHRQPYPIAWPADGAGVPLTRYAGREHPDPLAACPGYSNPVGLPLVVQFAATVDISEHTLSRDGTALDHCIFTGRDYRGHNQTETQLGRQVLAARNAVVLIPRQPLEVGGRYTFRIVSGGVEATSTFAVTDDEIVPAGGMAPRKTPTPSPAPSPAPAGVVDVPLDGDDSEPTPSPRQRPRTGPTHQPTPFLVGRDSSPGQSPPGGASTTRSGRTPQGPRDAGRNASEPAPGDRLGAASSEQQVSSATGTRVVDNSQTAAERTSAPSLLAVAAVLAALAAFAVPIRNLRRKSAGRL